MAKIIIVGGGVAGLSAGIYAQLAGHSATVYEKHFIPGGNLTGWQRGEYHIDNCIHWLTGTNPASSSLYNMWVELGALGENVDIIQGDTLITCEREGESISLPCSLERLKDEMLRVSPEDKTEIMRFISAVDFIMALENVAGEKNNEGITLGRMLRGVGPIITYYGLTTGQLAKRFKNSLLQCFITGFWGESFGAFALLYVYATFCGKNGGLPRGGSLKMADRMAERFKSLGGELYLGYEVVKVNHSGGVAKSVKFSNGEEASADYIILTTDTAVTYGRLLNMPMPKKLKKQYDNPKLRVFSAYHCAFACDEEDLPFEGDLIFDVPEKYEKILKTKQLIIREFSHEPNYAPKGKNILQSMTFCFEDDCRDFIELRKNDREAYKAKKEMLSSIIMRLIEEHCPTLRGKLTLIDVWTPASYNRFVGSEHGSFMSFAIPEKYAPIPLSLEVEGINNLLLATQWLQSPGGLPIAACMGKEAVNLINKAEKRK